MRKDERFLVQFSRLCELMRSHLEKKGEVLQRKAPAGAQQRHLLYQRATTGKKKAIESKQRKGGE